MEKSFESQTLTSTDSSLDHSQLHLIQHATDHVVHAPLPGQSYEGPFVRLPLNDQ